MNYRRFVNICLLLLVVVAGAFALAEEAQAADNHIQFPTPYGHTLGGTYFYSSDIYKLYSDGFQAGNHYYLSVSGRLWGQCSPDMQGCTDYRWIVKDTAFDQRYWSNRTSDVNISAIIQGIRSTKHYFQYNPSIYTGTTGYSSDQPNNAAGTSQCYWNGPGPHATPLPCP